MKSLFQALGRIAFVTTLLSTAASANGVAVDTEKSVQEISSPSVNHKSGGFSKSYPIQLPEYRGLPPQISLTYSSSQRTTRSVDSLLGPGWSIGGFSRIERVSPTGGSAYFEDGRDIFRLDGQELLACAGDGATNVWSGAYPSDYKATNSSASCSSGGNFAPLVENYLKIRFNGNLGDKSATFTVWRKDGTKLTYNTLAQVGGLTFNANHAARDRTYEGVWLLTSIENQQQSPSVVSIRYHLGGGYSWRPNDIRYANYRAQFLYESRLGNVPTFATGIYRGIGRQPHRLASVAIYDGTDGIGAYKVDYALSALTSTEQVSQIQQYGNNFTLNGASIVGGSTLPPVKFTYTQEVLSYQKQDHHPALLYQYQPKLVDQDLDGSTDILFPSIQAPAAHGAAAVYSSAAALTFDSNRTATSLNFGDVPSDAVGGLTLKPGSVPLWYHLDTTIEPVPFNDNKKRSNTRLYAYDESLSKLNEGLISSTNPEAGASPPIRFQNLGSTDRMEVVIGNGYKAINSDNRLVNISTADASCSSAIQAPKNFTLNPHHSSVSHRILRGDIRGNGTISSIIFNRELQTICELFGDTLTPLAKTYSMDTTQIPNTYLGGDFFSVGDFNGDGRDDAISIHAGVAYVALSNGNGLEPFVNWGTVHWGTSRRASYSLRDVNGDGLTDIISIRDMVTTSSHPDNCVINHFTNVTLACKSVAHEMALTLSHGDSFEQATHLNTLGISKAIDSGDFDGDGVIDFIVENPASPYHPHLHRLRIAWASFQPPHLMTSVKNEMGGTTSLEYLASSHPDVNDNDQIPGVRQLLHVVEQDDGRGQKRRTSYTYSGGKFDWKYRRSLGFGKITKTLPKLDGETTPPIVESYYNNEYLAQAGHPTRVLHSIGGAPLSETLRSYSYVMSGNGPMSAKLTKLREVTHEGDQQTTVTTLVTVDAFGETSRRRFRGYTDVAGNLNHDPSDDLTTSTWFVRDTDKYIVNRPRYIRTEASAEASSDLSLRVQEDFFFYDGLGYNKIGGYGNLTRTSRRLDPTSGSGMPTRTLVRHSYDIYGNIIQTTDARGATSTNAYDAARNLFLTNSTNALGHTESQTWNTACQVPATTTDANSLITTITHDAFCREYDRNMPGGNFTKTRYYNFGNPHLQRIQTQMPAASGPDNFSWMFFDGLGQTYRTAASGVTNAMQDRVDIMSSYDARGNMDWTSLPHLPSERGAYITGAADKSTHFTYDAQNRLTQTTAPDGSYSTTAYGINYATIADGTQVDHRTVRTKNEDCFEPNAQTTCTETFTKLDARDLTIQSWLFDRNLTDADATSSTWRVTSYSHDALGRLIGVKDPGGNTWAYEYDTFGNRLVSDDPDLGIWTMEYDAGNNLIRQTDAKGQVITFAYDIAGRATKKDVYKANGALEATTSSTYDEANAGYFNTGALTTIKTTFGGDTHRINYNYHELGGVEFEQHTIDNGRTYNIFRQFNPNGSVRNQKLPVGGSTAYNASDWVGEFQYDNAGRLTAFGPYITNVEHDVRGNAIRTDFGNGFTERRTHDAQRGWLGNVRVDDPSNNAKMNTTYTRSASGRITRQWTQHESGRFDYTYDYAGRLLHSDNITSTDPASSWNNYDQSFTYNKAGSLMSHSDIGTYVYNAANANHPHAPRKVGNTNLTYDANGNMQNGYDGKVMTYDAENRPLSVVKGGTTTSYVYGADGSRLKRTTGGSTTVTFANVEIRDYKASAETVLSYPHPSVRLENGVESYLHRDHLDSVALITSAAGAVTDTRTYKPFGEMWAQSDPAAVTETKGWIGERYDAGAGLQYLNARYYDPELGLFLQPDWFEVTMAGVGTNRYAYSGNNPVNFSDPWGNLFGLGPNEGRGDLNSSNSAAESFGLANNFSGSSGRGVSGQSDGQAYQLAAYYSGGTLPYADFNLATGRDYWGPNWSGGYQFGLYYGSLNLYEMEAPVPLGGGFGGLNTGFVGPIGGIPKKGTSIVGLFKAFFAVGSLVANQSKEPPVAGATPGRKTKGRTTQWIAQGGMAQADRDFDAMRPEKVKPINTKYGPGRTGRLNDGRSVTVRPGSSDGRPTIEIRGPTGRGDEIRYD